VETLKNLEDNNQVLNKNSCRFSKDPKIIRLRDETNLSHDEQISLNNLKDNKDLIIKPADKGGATVLINRENYIKEAERQLSNEKYYKKLTQPIYTKNIPKINTILSNMLNEKYINKKQFDYLSGPLDIKNRTFYLLPKIHKKPESWPQPGLMPEGRPIVSDVNSETYRISELIDSFINPLATKHETYIKNTYDFIDKIRNFEIGSNYLLVTGDITSLYTNMNIDRSIDCVKRAFSENPDVARPDQYLIELLELSMKNNDFEFAEKYYLQIMGTAMGKRFAPALANLYLLDFDYKAMNNFKIKPLLFFRFLDDIFCLWPGNVESLKEFEIFLNNLIPDISVTLEYSSKEINFLDTTVYVSNNTLQTRVYFKPTDTHQLLHKSSFHPRHTFKGILKSQYIRFKRISSTKTDYDNTSKHLASFLTNRGYSNTELRQIKNDIWYNYTEKQNDESNETTDSLIPITIDYCSIGMTLGRNFKNLIRQETIFDNHKIVLAFKNSLNLRQLLVRSKLSTKTEGSFRTCGEPRCKACKTHCFDAHKFSSTSLHKEFKMYDAMSCRSTNMVYLITCNQCQIQYVGETGRSLRERLADHRSAIKLKKNTPIGLHFNLPKHSFLSLNIVGIEIIKAQQNVENNRKMREAFWQKKLDTVHPKGLNNLPID